MTREARRNKESTDNRKHEFIDPDMLPPSDSDDEEGSDDGIFFIH